MSLILFITPSTVSSEVFTLLSIAMTRCKLTSPKELEPYNNLLEIFLRRSLETKSEPGPLLQGVCVLALCFDYLDMGFFVAPIPRAPSPEGRGFRCKDGFFR